MIAIYNNDGKITQIMTVYPKGYLEGLPDHDMRGLPVPQEMAALKKGGSIGREYYVKDGLFTRRVTNPLPDVIRLKVGENYKNETMPECLVTLGSETETVPAKKFEIEGEVAGEYALLVQCFPMQNKKVKVIVT